PARKMRALANLHKTPWAQFPLARLVRFGTVPRRWSNLEGPMLSISSHLSSRKLHYLLLMALALPSSGCLAAAITAGAVGAGAAGYAYYQGAVPRDYSAGMDQTWNATQSALADLGMPVVAAQRDDGGATIESRTGDGSKISISLEPRAARVPSD